MNREKKQAYIGLTMVSLVIGLGIFQNCSRAGYDEQKIAALLAAQGGNRKVTIDPTFNQEKANLKILLVVDDSYTMSQSQSQLANAIDSLMNPLVGHNVEFKIVSTSGIPSNEVDYSLSTKYFTEDRLEVQSSQLAGLPTYLVQKTVSTNSNAQTKRHPNLKLFRSSTNAQFNQLKTDLKSSIMAVGIGGSDTEEGLCSTVRQLFDESTNRFFKPGDKAVVVILSDENDSSTYQKCVSRYIQRASNQPTVFYDYGQQRVKLTLEYQIQQDGVTSWIPLAWGVSLSGARTIVNGTTCSAADQTFAVNKIVSQGYVIRNVTACVYETVVSTYYGADLGDNGSIPTKNSCTSLVTFNNQSFANLYDMVNSLGMSAQPNSCFKRVVPTGTLSNYIEYDSVIKPDSAANSVQSFPIAIKNKAQDLFGINGFMMASLIRKVGEPCPLLAGQSFGTAYLNLTDFLGPQTAISQSLCEADFSSTLSRVSNYLVTEAASSYVVTSMQANEKIDSVAVLRDGKTLLLDKSQYEVVFATITLTNFSLRQGDVLEVQIISGTP